VLVVVDDLIARSPNLVAGANKEDTHLRNVTYGRDYTADLVADIAAVRPGDPCPVCQSALEQFSTTVLARLSTPGARYSEALGATFQDVAGSERPLHLGCAEVDVDRLVAACVEVHHDEAGIRWPVRVAPYAVHLLTIGNAHEVLEAAAALEGMLQVAGIAVLFDDRDLSAGSKFVEADLLGMPLRVAVSKRTLAQSAAEVKRRDQPREAVRVVALAEVAAWVRGSLEELGGEDV
jgi:prolyl-tRNA synthetase